MGDALKSNTTLTELYLDSEHKRNNTRMSSVNNSLFSILINSTGNNIYETGATSLSDALKSNTSLRDLDLRSEDKRNNTQMIPINKQLSFSFSLNQQTTTLEKQERHH